MNSNMTSEEKSRGSEGSKVIISMIDIVHNLESRDYDSFHMALERQGTEKIEEWIRTMVTSNIQSGRSCVILFFAVLPSACYSSSFDPVPNVPMEHSH